MPIVNPTRIAPLLIATAIASLALSSCDRTQAQCRQALAELDQSQFTPETRHQQRGEIYYHCGDYANAISEFERAIAIDPNLATAYNGRARARLALNQLDLALADANRALQIVTNQPRNPNFNSNPAYLYYNLRGTIYNQQQNYQAAIADLTQSITLNPGEPRQPNGDAYYQRALAHQALGNREQARADLNQAIADYCNGGPPYACQEARDRLADL